MAKKTFFCCQAGAVQLIVVSTPLWLQACKWPRLNWRHRVSRKRKRKEIPFLAKNNTPASTRPPPRHSACESWLQFLGKNLGNKRKEEKGKKREKGGREWRQRTPPIVKEEGGGGWEFLLLFLLFRSLLLDDLQEEGCHWKKKSSLFFSLFF